MCCPRSVHLQRVCGGVGECVCEECKCQEGYSGMHCEYCDSTVIKVSPAHLPHPPVPSLPPQVDPFPPQCTGQQTCRLIGQQCLQCALEVVGRRVVLGENSCNHTNCPNITFVNTTLPLPEGWPQNFLCIQVACPPSLMHTHTRCMPMHAL